MTLARLHRMEVPFPVRLRRGLVAYWPLDEVSGTRRDVVGSNTLTDNNTVTQADGPSPWLPKAAQFTAANTEFLSITDNAALSMGAGVRFTIALRVYFDSLPTVVDLLAKNAVAGTREYRIFKGSNHRVNLEVSSNGTAVATAQSDFTLTTATWYTIFAWYDGAFIGIQVDQTAPVRAAFTADVVDGTTTFILGKAAAGTNYHDGRMCDVPIWKTVLTEAERRWWINNGSGRGLYPWA